MQANVGDRISLDAKKVGQPRRAGSVRALIEGLSGVRYEIAWDDGSVSVISPGAGVLLVEKGSKKAAAKKPAAKPAAKKPAAKKAAPKKKAGKKDAKAASKKRTKRR